MLRENDRDANQSEDNVKDIVRWSTARQAFARGDQKAKNTDSYQNRGEYQQNVIMRGSSKAGQKSLLSSPFLV